ncbi:MAG: S-layer homology domain-containing protein [Candidatus Peribacteraceae bacterium]|nr:S-layer homology domain-containing protein [Candidatus Peribacteraceae bacterium]
MHILLPLLIVSLSLGGTALAQQDTAFSENPFTDVPVNSTYYQSIEYLRTQNVLKGYLDGTFRPATRINRAEFVHFVVNPFIVDTNNMSDCLRANVPTGVNTVFFSDVARDSWYATDVCFAKMNSIIDGYPNGTYGPEKSINFVEAAKIICNVFSLNIEANDTGEFWYRPYVQRLSDLRAIPVSITRFDQTMTRGEMAEIVYRLKVNETKKASTIISNLR